MVVLLRRVLSCAFASLLPAKNDRGISSVVASCFKTVLL
jgi:hypothetical protein